MLDLNKIMEMWEVDCKIDQYNLDETSRNTPVLHSKYLGLINQAKMIHKYNSQKLAIMLKEKWLYYNGKLDKKDIDRKQWKYDPFDGMSKPLKGDMHYYYNSDKDLQELETKVEACQIIIDTLKEIMDQLKWKHQTIKNIIEWRKFESGA